MAMANPAQMVSFEDLADSPHGGDSCSNVRAGDSAWSIASSVNSDGVRRLWSNSRVLRMDSTRFLNTLPLPSAAKATRRTLKASGAAVAALWVLFVLNRASHPLLIDLSKAPDGSMPYQKLSPVIAKSFLSVLLCFVCAFFDESGWRAGLSYCCGRDSLKVFGAIGTLYALGDYLEMMSMASMDGAAYQVLLQSKLPITAMMMWAVKGSVAKQSPAQWSVLLTVTIGMSLFMMTQSDGSGKSSGSSSSNVIGTLFVLAKVVVSCYSAVMADSSLKKYSHLPLYAQLAQLMGTWGIASLLMAAVLEPAAVASTSQFFKGWNFCTILVVASFAAKTLLTMTLLKVLDSVQKNVGEAVAVLVVYVAQVLLPIFTKEFDMNSFLAMLVVVLTVATYILLKSEKSAAAKVQAKKEMSVHMSPDAKACHPMKAHAKATIVAVRPQPDDA